MATDNPWTAGRLTFSAAALATVQADALRGYAERSEACGYLSGPSDQPLLCDEAVAMENRANKLHKLDPERYFRTAESYFEFDVLRFSKALEAGAAAGRPVKVLYHSHLDVGAYFSPTDKAAMSMGEMPAREGGDVVLGPGPAWPLAFLVASVRAGGVDDFKLFVWQDGDFVESSFRVQGGAD